MTPEERLRTIVDYLQTQKYLKGLGVHVRIVERDVRLEFKGISTDQIQKLRRDLDDREQFHIKIINLDKKKKRRKKKKRSDQRPLNS